MIYIHELLGGNLFGLYANDHSQFVCWENVRGCLSPSCHAFYETYRITYSIRLHGKIFAIEHKIMKSAKVFPLEGFVTYGTYLLIIHLMIMYVAIAYNIFFNGAQGKLYGVPVWCSSVVYACAYVMMSLMCYEWSFNCCSSYRLP